MFAIKYGSTNTEDSVSLKEYLAQFSDDVDSISEEQLSFDIELYIHKLNEIFIPDFEVSQIECLIHIAGYAVFSYFKRSNGCLSYHNFLTTDKPLEVNNDVGYLN